ncbi:uncharacterized protein [Littorina saxatilis]|uniref:Uncharacterized protein n=1 Tax=Littorina saxatilis TaxID=31220 RepID=A0AAN9BTR6_9CAEN
MGNGRLSRLFGGKQELKIMILGLDASGKTTCLYQLTRSDVEVTIPTIGMNIESTSHKGLHIMSWDVGGRDKIRPLLRHYYHMMNALVFMVDSGDRERLDQAKDEFHKVAQEEELQNIPVLVLANKQDLPGVMNVSEVAEGLEREKLLRDPKRVVGVLPVSASTGEGVTEALEWIQHHLTLQKVQEALVKPAQKSVPSSLTSLFTSVSSALKHTLGNSR